MRRVNDMILHMTRISRLRRKARTVYAKTLSFKDINLSVLDDKGAEAFECCRHMWQSKRGMFHSVHDQRRVPERPIQCCLVLSLI